MQQETQEQQQPNQLVNKPESLFFEKVRLQSGSYSIVWKAWKHKNHFPIEDMDEELEFLVKTNLYLQKSSCSPRLAATEGFITDQPFVLLLGKDQTPYQFLAFYQVPIQFSTVGGRGKKLNLLFYMIQNLCTFRYEVYAKITTLSRFKKMITSLLKTEEEVGLALMQKAFRIGTNIFSIIEKLREENFRFEEEQDLSKYNMQPIEPQLVENSVHNEQLEQLFLQYLQNERELWNIKLKLMLDQPKAHIENSNAKPFSYFSKPMDAIWYGEKVEEKQTTITTEEELLLQNNIDITV